MDGGLLAPSFVTLIQTIAARHKITAASIQDHVANVFVVSSPNSDEATVDVAGGPTNFKYDRANNMLRELRPILMQLSQLGPFVASHSDEQRRQRASAIYTQLNNAAKALLY